MDILSRILGLVRGGASPPSGGIPVVPGVGIRRFSHPAPFQDTTETQVGNQMLFGNVINRPNLTSFGVESERLRNALFVLSLIRQPQQRITAGFPFGGVTAPVERGFINPLKVRFFSNRRRKKLIEKIIKNKRR